MKNKSALLKTTFAGVVALGLSVSADNANATPSAPKNWEKCSGVAKAGKNDCGSINGSHACAGMSKVDSDPNEWLYVPEGTCDKIGGKVEKVVPTHNSAHKH